MGRFLKITLRFLWRNKSYTILNYLCLTFGLTCSIIALLYILNESGYDKFHKNYDRLYEVEANVTYFNGASFLKEPLSASLGDVLLKNVPEIESLTRIAYSTSGFVSEEKSFSEQGVYADDNFFNLFTFPMVTTSGSNVLSEISSIVISERLAGKLFKTTDCLGKTVVLNDEDKKQPFKIAGVFRNVPAQSLMQFDYVIPFSKFLAENSWANETGASANQIWVLLKKNVNFSKVAARIKDLIKNQESTLNQELFLFPLKEKILYRYSGGKRVWGEMQRVVIVGSIGFAILLIACFNFINLAVALNIKRYREVGLKKATGAKRSDIILQFMGETYLLITISLFSAIVLARLFINGFNTIFNGNIHLGFTDVNVILFISLIALFTGLVSGLLPSFYLSYFNPVSLKSGILTSHSYSIFRQSLIIFQFAIPVVLIISMMIIKVQDKYIRDYDLGFDKDKLIVLSSTKNLEAHEESFKSDLLAIPGIEAISFTNCIPTRGSSVSNEVMWEGKDPLEKLHFWCINTDYNYSKAVQIKMTSGRYFDRSFVSDSACYIINDIAAGIMKSKDPVGSSLTLDGKKGTIIGVFSNFHSVDLRGPFTPVIISVNRSNRNNLLIRFSSGSYSSIRSKIAGVYKRYESDKPYQPVLFSDLPDFAGLKMTSNLVGLAFFIALTLGCLGLSGLASFTAERRTKEIGIRKSNGASVLSIMDLLLRSYSWWLIIAFLVAIPVSVLLGRLFLSGFSFCSPMPFWPFIAGPALSGIIALFSVSRQSLRAALRNPVDALKHE